MKFYRKYLLENFERGRTMNRRNVLGHKIEESKSCWVVLTGILVCALQCLINYSLGVTWLKVLLLILIMLAGTAAVHFITGELGELFTFLLVPVAFFGALGLATPYLTGTVLPYSRLALWEAVIVWLIPMLYAIIFAWIEGFSVMEEFAGFYFKATILFYVVYYGTIIAGMISVCSTVPESSRVQMMPFATFAAYIDGLVKGTVTMPQLSYFLITHTFLFIPFGFFVAMVCRTLHNAIKVILLVAFPTVLVLIRLLAQKNNFDIDDIVFCFLGGLLGMLFFYIFNTLFQNITNRNFDGSEVSRDYYGRRI